MVYSTKGEMAAVLGDITLRLLGDIKSTECYWEFTGVLRSFDDLYDFNPGNRGPLNELITEIAHDLGGTSYWIEIKGEKPISVEPIPWSWFE